MVTVIVKVPALAICKSVDEYVPEAVVPDTVPDNEALEAVPGALTTFNASVNAYAPLFTLSILAEA